MKGSAVLAPGFGGSAEQPLIKRLAARLEKAGLVTSSVTFSARRPSTGYSRELDDIRAIRDALATKHGGPLALVGRSYGGRMSAFLAQQEPPDALVILGHPIAPPGRPRPRDEETLAALTCPTLIVQGDRDELGPLAVLERAAAHNPRVDIVVIKGAGHAYGTHEGEAIEHVARWLEATLGG